MPSGTSNSLYHYTSLNSLLGILLSEGSESVHENDLCFWASRFDCMNDAIDCQYALQLPLRIIKSYASDFSISRTIFPYVVSFCKKGDYLSMWRLYSSYVCIELDKDAIAEHINTDSKSILFECKYSKDDIESIKDLLEAIVTIRTSDLNHDIWNKIQCAAAFIKHKSFEEETECRIVKFVSNTSEGLSIPFKSKSNVIVSEDVENLSFRITSNGLTPYHKIYLPKRSLKGIIVREYDNEKFQKVKTSIGLVLKKRGIDISESKIRQSEACKIYK